MKSCGSCLPKVRSAQVATVSSNARSSLEKLLERKRKPRFSQRLSQNSIGDRFGVNEHPITIEYYEINHFRFP